MAQIYKMHDVRQDGMHRIQLSEAEEANKNGYGIFWTINSFNGARKISNLVSVDAWAIDIDTGTKEEMWKKINSGLPPTMVVESKRSLHAYWKAKLAEAKHWNAIVLDRLVPFYGADSNARDLARVLRVPGFMHLKNPEEPFLVKKVWEYPVEYTERDMAYFYPDPAKEEREEFKKQSRKISGEGSDDLWTAVWHMDCAEALIKLSGSDAVCGDVITLKPTSNGKQAIWCNGKGTSCWVDAEGRIGSLDKGGPTILQWINWYQHDKKKAVFMLKTHFPELPWSK